MFISIFEFFGQMLVDLFVYSSNLGFDLFFDPLFETFGNLVTNLLFDFVGNLSRSHQERSNPSSRA